MNNLLRANSMLVEAVLLLLTKRNLRLGRNNIMTKMQKKSGVTAKEIEDTTQ